MAASWPPAQISGVALHWWILLGFCGIAACILTALGGVIGLILLALALPALQLAACFIAAVVVGSSTRQDKSYQLGQLGKTAGGIITGGAIGIVLMFLLVGVLRR
jgi:hypothetical protein